MNLIALSIIALTMGHVFSNAVRTLPAIAADVLQRDLGVTADGLAALTGAFPATFALAMLPVGVALDRWGVKPTALCLLSIAAIGAVLGAYADSAWSMLVAQMILGIGCSGMLMCPITYAAKNMPAQRFGLWGGIVQALGNTGMVISASPLAFLVEYSGWRAGFIACAGLATKYHSRLTVPFDRSSLGIFFEIVNYSQCCFDTGCAISKYVIFQVFNALGFATHRCGSGWRCGCLY